MVLKTIKKIFFLAIILISLNWFSGSSFSQISPTSTPTPTPNNSQAISDLQNKINDLQNKINDLKSQEKTLSSQIAVMDGQIKLTEYKIDSTQQQILELALDIDTASKKIGTLQKSLDNSINVLLNRIVATYQIGTIQPLQILLTSGNASDFLVRLNYLKLAQAHDKKLIYETQQAKNDYANQKEIFEDKKKQIEVLKQELEEETAQLNAEKVGKQKLLAETKGSEKNYQTLLTNARAEFEAIQGIVSGNGTEGEVGSVNQGDVVATIISGSSCNSTGTHLHFTVSRNGATENPFNYLKSVDHTNDSGGDPFDPHGDWEWPISSPIDFNQGYGQTWFVRTYHAYSFHNGIDIGSSSSLIRAVKSGTLYQGSYTGSNGCKLRYVRVHHNDGGLDTFYLHVNYVH